MVFSRYCTWLSSLRVLRGHFRDARGLGIGTRGETVQLNNEELNSPQLSRPVPSLVFTLLSDLKSCPQTLVPSLYGRVHVEGRIVTFGNRKSNGTASWWQGPQWLLLLGGSYYQKPSPSGQPHPSLSLVASRKPESLESS